MERWKLWCLIERALNVSGVRKARAISNNLYKQFCRKYSSRGCFKRHRRRSRNQLSRPIAHDDQEMALRRVGLCWLCYSTAEFRWMVNGRLRCEPVFRDSTLVPPPQTTTMPLCCHRDSEPVVETQGARFFEFLRVL